MLKAKGSESLKIQQLVENLELPKENIKFNEPMSKHTTFKIGGPAECFIKIDKTEDALKVLELAKFQKIPLTIIGNGSNILVSDDGIKGIVLKIDINKFEIKEDVEDVKIIVGAGNKLARYRTKTIKRRDRRI